jgi:methionyl-tRNA synthetase
VDGCCPDHKIPPVKQKEENYFFLLSKFAKPLLEKIQSGEFEIGPISRSNEIIGKIKQGLEDSISRQAVEWGVKFPGDESQTIYVWIDALLNYYTATQIFKKEDLWPADLHLMAKDILWFHAVIWPAMLMAAELPLPKKVFAHGFFTINGEKMSKTRGNVIDPNKVVDKFGADAVRYALLREFPFGEDGDISEEKIENSYNKLANNIGNLLHRTISMVVKYDLQAVVSSSSKESQDNESMAQKDKLNIDSAIESLDFMAALKKIDSMAEDLNSLIAEKQPWVLAKEGKTKELSDVLEKSFSGLSAIAESLEPFMPETAEKMKKQLETLAPEPLFPRLD